MKVQEKKLSEIAEIISGIPINRYYAKEYIDESDIIKDYVIQQKAITEINTKFKRDPEDFNQKIDEKYFTRTGDILFKLQVKCFAKQITTETNAIVTHSYAIIRLKEGYDVTFIEALLNDQQIIYELERKISSTTIPKVNLTVLKNLKLPIPDYEDQIKYAKVINLINNKIKLEQKNIENDIKLRESIIYDLIGDLYDY